MPAPIPRPTLALWRALTDAERFGLRADVFVEIAFGTDPGDEPVWTDVTDRLRGFSTSRGRQHELDRNEAGTAAILLYNRDRALDPTNVDSPYYPNVLPQRRVRVRLEYDGESYPLLTGFADGFPQVWPDAGTDALVEVGATDGFEPLALSRVTGSYEFERTDVRIGLVLDDAGWPAALRDLNVGQSTVQATDLDQTPALEHLQEVEVTENGRLFVNVDGEVRFIDRHAPLLDLESLAVFGDAEGELPYVDLGLSFDKTQIWNEVIVSREGGTPQTAEDATSQARHFRRTLLRDTLITSDAEAADAAGWLLSRYATPDIRADSLVVNPLADPELWPVILNLELGDRVTVRKRPMGGGDPIERDVLLEGIDWRYDGQEFEWSARLSPAGDDAWAVWGSAVWGESFWAY